MKNKLLPLLLAVTMLTSCGGDNDNSNNTAPETAETIAETTTSAPDETAPEEPTETQTQEVTSTVTEETSAETDAETDISTEETTAETTTAKPEQTTSYAETTTAATEAVTESASASEDEIVVDDSVENASINSNFADMNEFLSSPVFMLDGKTVNADQTLSADIFKAFQGDFYYETSEFNSNSSYRLAVADNKIMTETKADGKSTKMIIADSKAYTFDHENKVALFLPADKELISQYNPEKMGIIPENVNSESFVIADVTIGGEKYKFEYATSSDWAMLYNTDGKLYASVANSDTLDLTLRKFSVTNKIPSDAFNIPADYLQIDLEEMMQNAPPPENME